MSQRYPIFGVAVLNTRGEIERRMIVPPSVARLDGHRIYNFIFDGVHWSYSVSSHRNEPFIECGLQLDGSMSFGTVPWHRLPLVQRAAQSLRHPVRRH